MLMLVYGITDAMTYLSDDIIIVFSHNLRCFNYFSFEFTDQVTKWLVIGGITNERMLLNK